MNIVFEDAHVVVCEKEAGIASERSPDGNDMVTLLLSEGRKEIYRGHATIAEIAGDEMRDYEKKQLSDADKLNAFKLVYRCEATNGGVYDVEIEISHRELKGKMLEYFKREDGETPTQMDVSIRSLVQQGILKKGATEADIGSAFAQTIIGKDVIISVTQDPKNDGTGGYYSPRARFVKDSLPRLTGGDLAARFAAFRSCKPAPKPTRQTIEAAPTPPPAPEDENNLPF